MKRSEINGLIQGAIDLLGTIHFKLPPFAFWGVSDWQNIGHEADEIRLNGLGWDVTDYGFGTFEKMGLLLFTIRNGNQKLPEQFPKGYAEKIMIVKEGQVTPWHYHWNKREDIINRGGGNLVIKLCRSDGGKGFSDSSFHVSIDGVKKQCSPHDKVVLTPGESICLEPHVYHTFYGEAGRGTVVVGEVSDVNDDANDNCFYEKIGRFPQITEDVPPLYYLCTEYPKANK